MNGAKALDVAAYPGQSAWSLRRISSDPVSFVQRLAADGDVVGFSLHGRPAFLLSHPDFVEDVLVVNHSKFCKPPGFFRGELLGSGLLTAEGDLHRARRRALQPAFGPLRLEGYSRTVLQCVDDLLSRWHDGDVVDIATEMHWLAVQIMGRILFGADMTPHAAAIRRALGTASASLDPLLSLLSPARRLRPARAYLRNLIDQLLDERWNSPDRGNDVVSLLRQADPEAPAADSQVRDDVLTLLIAGHDTIANALTWTWYLLAAHPDVESSLRIELDAVLDRRPPSYDDLGALPYTASVLSESLRLFPPSWILTRQATETHRLGATAVPAGAIVLISQYVLHRDPRFFDDPLTFNPNRWSPGQTSPRARRAYLPFGAGPRSCIGQGLAMLEGTLVLAAIASNWRCSEVTRPEVDARATLRPRGPALMKVEKLSEA
jgi:cytochrome P450